MIATESAINQIKELLAGEDDSLFLRVAVRPGGCSGMSYEMFFDSSIQDDDIINDRDEIKIVIDILSNEYLDKAILKFDSGLMGKGFVIDNPSANRTCGCGQSFS